MEWFKHSTGSHDDPDISDAIDLFGLDGYSVFFITLEIYGTEFNHLDPGGWLNISRTFVQRKLRKSSTKVEQILNFYSDRQRINFKSNGQRLSIRCPKFIEIASNWTKRNPPFPTEVPTEAPTEVPTAKEEEEKKKRRRREKNTPLPPNMPLKIKAEELLSFYPKISDPINSLKSILKLFNNPPPELWPCPFAGLKNRINQYQKFLDEQNTEKQFIIQSNNFFGKAARWKETFRERSYCD